MSDKQNMYRTYELLIGQLGSRKSKRIIGDERDNTGYNISFRIKKHIDNKENTNTAVIEIYNLEDEIVNYMEESKTGIVLSVGYNKNNILLFRGIIQEINTDERGMRADARTILKCSPSDLSTYEPSISKTFPANTSPRTVINYVVSNSPSITRASFNSSVVDQAFPFGYTIEGSPKEVLSKLASDYDFQYRVDNQRLYVNDNNRYQSPNSVSRAIKLTEDTGLLGSPTYASADGRKLKKDTDRKNGVKFTALMNPLVYPGSAVSIVDAKISGIFRVNYVEYTGEWRSDNNWHITCHCSKLNAQEV